MGATIKVLTEFTAKDKFTSVILKMIKSTKNFSQKSISYLNAFDLKVKSVYRSLSGFSRLGLGLGFGVLMRHGLNSVLDFESGLVLVKKTTGLADAEITRLGHGVLELDKQLRGISSLELLKVAGVAGQMGERDINDILKFSKTMTMLEKSTDLIGEEGAMKISRLLNVTKEGTKTIDSFASSLVALGNTNAAYESEILEVASEVGRGTSQYGLGSANILAIASSLKSLDVNPQAAGTAIAKTFRQIELATLKGGKKLTVMSKVIGKTPTEIKEAFSKDKNAVFVSFVKGLSKINKEGGSVLSTMIDLGLSSELVNKGIIPLSSKFDLLSDNIKTSGEAYKLANKHAQEYELATKTIRLAFNDMIQSYEAFVISATNSKEQLGWVRWILNVISDNMGFLIKTTLTMTALWLLAKGLIIGFNAVMFISNTYIGLRNALTLRSTALIAGNTVAMRAATVGEWLFIAAMKVNTMATLGWAAALNLGLWPLTLIMITIAALSYLIYKMVEHWDSWGAAVSVLLGPLGVVVALVMSFVKHWDKIKKSFAEDGFLSGLWTVAKVLTDGILYPMQQLFGLMSKIPGLGFLGGAEKFLGDVRASLDLEGGEAVKKPYDSPESVTSRSFSESHTQNSLNINVKQDKGLSVDTELEGPSGIGINFEPTS